MIPLYTLRLFDTFQLQVAEKQLSHFATERGQALLAYLLLNSDRVHTRAALAELLWPDQPARQSRQNLRQTISRMRRDLCLDALDDPFEGDYHTVRLDASRFAVDALHFGALLESCKAHRHRSVERCPTCADQLRQAVALYRGEFLTGLGVDESPIFEDWLLIQRELFHRQAVDALQTLIAYHRHLEDHTAVRGFAEQLIRLEPYQESAYVHFIEALALLGEREAALTHYDRCLAMLTDELGVAPGERLSHLYTQLKQFSEPVALMKEMQRQLPPLSRRHHFPQFLVPFFGRQKEIAQIGARLADPHCRILTIIGPGGIGKSRLLTEAAHHINPLNYPDGLYFVPLAPISDLEGMIRAIADAIAIPLQGGSIQSQLLLGLAPLRLLLVLDNFEHLMDAVPLVLEILEKAPGVSCLVSSRHPLQLQAEWLLPLNGLDYPAEANDPQIAQYSAVAFFLDRARRMRPDFDPSPADYAAILEICRLVSGMPLAITMAASWLSAHDCATLAAQIGKNLDFFAVPLRDLPSRHQSMRATFEVSWRLLPPSAQQALAHLSIFHDTFSHDAMQAVTPSSTLDLSQLVSHSLVTRVTADRYTLHELVRQFAAEKLDALGQTETVRRAHTSYYLTLLGDAEAEIRGPAQLRAVGRLRVDLPHLRAAWLTAAVEHQWDLVQRSLMSFERFWLAVGTHADGHHLLAVTAEHLTQDLNEEAWQPSLNGNNTPPSSGQRYELLTRIKLAQGHFAQTYAPLREAIAVVQQAFTLAQGSETVSADLMGEIHLMLSRLYHQQGNLSPAEHHLNEAYAQLGQSTDLALQALLYLELSRLSGHKGDEAERRLHLEHAMTLAEQSGDLHVDVTVRRYLTHMQNRWGDYTRVRHHIERLLHSAQLIQNVAIEAYALNLYAGYYFQMGDFDRMAAYHERAVPLLHKIGSIQALAIYYMRQGLCALFVGDLARAMTWSQDAISFARSYHYRDIEAFALILLGRVQTAAGTFDAGWQSFAQAMQQMDQYGRMPDYLAAVVGQASILCSQGKAFAAMTMIEPSLDTILTGDLGVIVDYTHVYADAYRILRAAEDPRSEALLARARSVLTRVISTIPTAELRHSFEQNIPSHRLILTQQPHLPAR